MSDFVPAAPANFVRARRRLAGPLSVAQLITWGSIYYSFTLFVEPMEQELRLGRTGIMGALTVGLLVCAAASPVMGWLIDRGYALDHAVLAATSYGPAMLAARFFLTVAAERVSLPAIACLAFCPLIFGLVYLAAGPVHISASLALAIALGCGNGILTLAKPLAVAHMFGEGAFGAVNGMLTVPLFVLRAFTPVGLAAMWAIAGSYNPIAWQLAGLLAVALILSLNGIQVPRLAPRSPGAGA
ncbi:MAG: hypothetical protein VW268_15665 [Rhodospirillaceae bacterium]